MTRALLALGLGGAAWLALLGAPARADEGDVAADTRRLDALGRALADADALVRDAAIEQLGHLREDSLPAIDTRVRSMRPGAPPDEDAREALFRFRHAVGSRRADDRVDIAPGVEIVLAERRDPTTRAMAERLLLVRSLEGIGGVEGVGRIADLLALGFEAWRVESQRIVERMGARALPGLLHARGHRDPDVRRWARDALETLGLASPADAVRGRDPALLAEILRAYGATLDMDAMAIVAPFIGAPDTIVREAAREAMDDFGRNGIWQLRIVTRNQLGREADPSWGWERTRDELYDGLDEARLAPSHHALDAGLAAFAAGDLETMSSRFDEALLLGPKSPRAAEMAPGYAALARDHESAGRLDAALDAFRRAIELGPDSNEQARWRAEAAWIEARTTLPGGVLDPVALERAIAADPTFAPAREAQAELSPAQAGGNPVRAPWLPAMLAIAGLLLVIPANAYRRARTFASRAGSVAEGWRHAAEPSVVDAADIGEGVRLDAFLFGDAEADLDVRPTLAEETRATVAGVHEATTVPGLVVAPVERETVVVEGASLASLVQSSLSTSPGAIHAPE